MYIAIISRHNSILADWQIGILADLMGYQMIIMEASLGSREGKWLT